MPEEVELPTLSSQIDHALNGKNSPLHGKEDHQTETEDKSRHIGRDERRAHGDAVKSRIPTDGRDETNRDPERDGQDQRAEEKDGTVPQSLLEKIADGHIAGERAPQI